MKVRCNIPISIGRQLGMKPGFLVKWLAHLLYSQKVVGSCLNPPALLCEMCSSVRYILTVLLEPFAATLFRWFAHSGLYIYTSSSHSENRKNGSLVSAAIAHVWSSFNLFQADFGHIHPYVQCKLFKQYCWNVCMVHPCGSYLVKVCDACIAMRKAFKKNMETSTNNSL